MELTQRIAGVFGGMNAPGHRQLWAGVEACRITMEDLEPLLPVPSIYPYGRRPLYASEHLELLVMNWATSRECAPHDHGQSCGWVVVMDGEAKHAVFKVNARGTPILSRESRVQSGTRLFAPRGLIHSMGNPTTGRLVTLHAYAPRITRMKVYDLVRCAACVVSDDCGAWWPESDRQLIQQISLTSRGSTGSYGTGS